jgi:hypothetical protein
MRAGVCPSRLLPRLKPHLLLQSCLRHGGVRAAPPTAAVARSVLVCVQLCAAVCSCVQLSHSAEVCRDGRLQRCTRARWLPDRQPQVCI